MRGAHRLAASRRIPLAIQRLHLQTQTNGACNSQKHDLIRWEYSTTPYALSRTYQVLITYMRGGTPDAFVFYPNLDILAAGRTIPHIYRSRTCSYSESTCLCLYRLKYGDWSPQMLLAHTVVPWVDLWLLYFEEWLITNEWKGGGEHPS